jgi:isovaleryl-CoA dehydrogenase
MRLGWDARQAELKERLRRFAEAEVAPGAERRDRSGLFDRDLWRRLADVGLWRLLAPGPEAEPGELWDFLAGFEGLASGAAEMSLVLSAIAHAGLIHVLLRHGTGEQRARWLPLLSSGGIGATAATEPGGGSHVTSIRTTAVPEGDGYLLTGEKAHITNAPVADVVLVVGRVPSLGERDITLFLVPGGAEGVSLGPPERQLGQRSSPTGPVRLERVFVRTDDVVGGAGGGLSTLYAFLAFDRLMYAVATAGLLEPLIATAMDRACTRRAFGVPLAEHELIQDKLVEMKVTMEASRWLAYSAVAALGHDDLRCSSQASVAKIVAAEGMVRSALELIQLFGHAGYADGPIERVLRDAVALRIAGGTTEMQKKNVFKHLLLDRAARTGAPDRAARTGAQDRTAGPHDEARRSA